MFGTLEKIAQGDPKYADIVLLENYAAFQNRLFRIYLSYVSLVLDLSLFMLLNSNSLEL